MKIAEGLLLRKQLAQKVEQLKTIKVQGDQGLLEVKFSRKPVQSQTEHGLDELVAQVPKITMKEFTKEFDLYASELRKLDAALQQANWAFDLNYNQPAEIKQRGYCGVAQQVEQDTVNVPVPGSIPGSVAWR